MRSESKGKGGKRNFGRTEDNKNRGGRNSFQNQKGRRSRSDENTENSYEKRDNKKSGKLYPKKEQGAKVGNKAGFYRALSGEEGVRLNRYISNAGLCSRREADKQIEMGLVTVNGKVITEMGTKVTNKDEVRVNGQKIKSEKKVYVLLNKPKDHVTTMDDPHAKRTVMSLIAGACKERVYPVGRLDKNTTGVLLFTNDGELAARLTHPKYKKKKLYHASLDKPMLKSDMEQLLKGVELEDGMVTADAIEYANPDDKKQIGIEIHSGKNRIVRRMFAHLGYDVVKLDRPYFAGLTKKGLKRGQWRMLTEKEINFLRMGSL